MLLKARIESILLVSNFPLTYERLCQVTGEKSQEKIKEAVFELLKDYKERDNSGIQLIRAGKTVQLTTASENAKTVQKFIHRETTGELTRASLETLTIIAYRGEVTRAEIEVIRGVNCSVILRNLSMRGLIASEFNKKQMETVYTITADFMKYLGISDVKELPDYERLNSSENLEKILES